jgi:hypothetical protein
MRLCTILVKRFSFVCPYGPGPVAALKWYLLTKKGVAEVSLFHNGPVKFKASPEGSSRLSVAGPHRAQFLAGPLCYDSIMAQWWVLETHTQKVPSD